jgi:hypothetical protein
MTELPTDLGLRILAATRLAVMEYWQAQLARVTDDTPAPGQERFPDHQQRDPKAEPTDRRSRMTGCVGDGRRRGNPSAPPVVAESDYKLPVASEDRSFLTTGNSFAQEEQCSTACTSPPPGW